MKVLLHIDSLGSGGAQRQLCLLARGLRARGWPVQVAIYHPELDHFEPLLTEAQVPIHRVTKGARFSLRPPLALAWHAVESNADVVVTFLATPTIYGAMMRAAGGPPLISSERFALNGDTPGRWKILTACAQRLASAVVCNSHHHAATFVKTFPWLRRKTITIYNGFELPPCGPPHGLSADGIRLLALGTVTDRKNPRLLAQALVICREAGVRISVSWAGKVDAKSPDADVKREVDALLDRHGLAGNWRWLGERRDVNTLLKECDALAHPSRLEGFPNAIGEALAAGRPVFASEIGDHARLVEHGANGFLFPLNDPAAFARCLERFANLGAGERAEMGRQARKTAEEKLSLEAMVEAYVRLLGALCPTVI